MIFIKIKFDFKKTSNLISKIIPYVVLCSGIFLIAYGAGLIYKPVGFITLGILGITALLAVDFK